MRIVTLALVVGLSALVARAEAQFRRTVPVPIIYGYGDHVVERADLDDEVVDELERDSGLVKPRVGFKYSYFSVFYIFVLWTHSGEFVIYDAFHYLRLEGDEDLQSFAGVDVAELTVPISYRIPSVFWWLLPVPLFLLLKRHHNQKLRREVEESQRRYYASKGEPRP